MFIMVRRLKCPVEGCTQGENKDTGGTFKTENDYDTLDQAQKAMEMHLEGHRLGNAAILGFTDQEWGSFISNWKQLITDSMAFIDTLEKAK